MDDSRRQSTQQGLALNGWVKAGDAQEGRLTQRWLRAQADYDRLTYSGAG
jgi:hypothetical protein